MNNSEHSLRSVDIFKDLSDEKLNQIEERCQWRSYAPGTHIIDRMSTSMDIYFITRGMVRAVNFSESGREISLNDIEPGSHFGELSAIDGQPRSANVVAVYSTTVASMSRELFLNIIEENPIVARKLLERLAKIIRISVDRIMDLSTLSAYGRVYGELIKLAEKRIQKDGTARISPIPVHSDIANRISTTRETVARILSDLYRKGIVVKERNVLIVTDMKALEALHKIQV